MSSAREQAGTGKPRRARKAGRAEAPAQRRPVARAADARPAEADRAEADRAEADGAEALGSGVPAVPAAEARVAEAHVAAPRSGEAHGGDVRTDQGRSAQLRATGVRSAEGRVPEGRSGEMVAAQAPSVVEAAVGALAGDQDAGQRDSGAKVIPIGAGRGGSAGARGRAGRERPAGADTVTGIGLGADSGGTSSTADDSAPMPPAGGFADAVAGAVGHALAGPLGGIADRMLGKGWEDRAAGGLSFLRRRLTGAYEVDEFGFDRELTEQVLLTAVRPIAEKYFRLEVRGAENLPTTGGALVVANHSGVLPWDALMTQVAIHDNTPTRRHLRMLAADLVFVLPGVNEIARKAGHTLACNEDAQRLLELGEIVGVWPEGFKGIGKPFAERYKLQRFGRGGFVSSALRAGVPIVPCAIVGAEEIHPMIGNAKTLARILGVPYVPITPTFPWLGPLGMVPLPTKWTIQFGEPIPTDSYPPEAAEDPMLLFNLTDQVRETVQHSLYKLLMQRRSVFF